METTNLFVDEAVVGVLPLGDVAWAGSGGV